MSRSLTSLGLTTPRARTFAWTCRRSRSQTPAVFRFSGGGGGVAWAALAARAGPPATRSTATACRTGSAGPPRSPPAQTVPSRIAHKNHKATNKVQTVWFFKKYLLLKNKFICDLRDAYLNYYINIWIKCWMLAFKNFVRLFFRKKHVLFIEI